MLRLASWIGDLAVAGCLVGLGIVWSVLSWRLGLGDSAEPGAGLFPFAVSLLLAGGGVGCAIRAVVRRPAKGDGETVELDAQSLKAAVLVAALCLLFADAGFYLAGFGFMWLMLVWVGRVTPGRATLASALAILACWLVFDHLLALGLPGGFVGDLLAPGAG